MSRFLKRPSPAMLVACLALFVALGGPAQAQRLLDGAKIKRGSVTAKQIKRGSITGDRLRAGTVSLARLSRATIRRLQETPPGEVDVQKLADGAVNSSKVADRSLAATDLADNSLGQAQLGPNAVAGAEIQDGSIDSSEILNGRLFGVDIAGFQGISPSLDIGTVEANKCKQVTFQPAEVQPAGQSPRDLKDDIILLTPTESFLKDQLVSGSWLSYTARPESDKTIGIVLCNPTTAPVAGGSQQFLYTVIDQDPVR